MKAKRYLRELAKTVLVFSVCILLFSTIKLIPALAAVKYTGQTVGTASIVLDTEDSGGHAGGTKHYVYIDYRVNEKDYYTSVVHGRFDDPQVGDTYHIRYDTENPEKCYVDSAPNGTLRSILISVIAEIVLIAASSLSIKYLAPSKAVV